MLISNTIITAIIIFVIDLVWLSTGGIRFKNMIAAIQSAPVVIRPTPIIPIYIALAYLLNKAKTVQEAGLIGLATYTVFDMTNYAVLKDYNLWIALADSVWGGVLFMLSFSLIKYFNLGMNV